MKPFKVGQKFVNRFRDTIEVTEVTRYRIYFKVTFGAVGPDVFGLPLTYGQGMATKAGFREALEFFVEVN